MKFSIKFSLILREITDLLSLQVDAIRIWYKTATKEFNLVNLKAEKSWAVWNLSNMIQFSRHLNWYFWQSVKLCLAGSLWLFPKTFSSCSSIQAFFNCIALSWDVSSIPLILINLVYSLETDTDSTENKSNSTQFAT